MRTEESLSASSLCARCFTHGEGRIRSAHLRGRQRSGQAVCVGGLAELDSRLSLLLAGDPPPACSVSPSVKWGRGTYVRSCVLGVHGVTCGKDSAWPGGEPQQVAASYRWSPRRHGPPDPRRRCAAQSLCPGPWFLGTVPSRRAVFPRSGCSAVCNRTHGPHSVLPCASGKLPYWIPLKCVCDAAPPDPVTE